MIHAIGSDLVDLERIRGILATDPERFMKRILTDAERRYCERLADPAGAIGARFAAKEAVMKCLGTGWAQGLSWREIEVVRDEHGAPSIRLSGRAAEIAEKLGIVRILVSLSHTPDHSLAMAVADTSER